jgi:ATP synthase protein I
MNFPNEANGARRTGWAATVGTALLLQWGVVLAIGAVAWLWGSRAGASAVLGGAAVALPNTLLAAWLTARVLRHGVAGPAAMLGGEMLKLGMTVGLMYAAVRANPGVQWLALLAGVVGALKAQWLAVWFTRKY